MSDTPEHEKLKEISHLSQAIGEFLDWASEAQGWHLAEWDHLNGESRLYQIRESRTDQLALYFNIDLNALEDEKLAILEEIRAASK